MVPHVFGGPGSFPPMMAVSFPASNEFSVLNEPPFTHSTSDRSDLSFSIDFWWALVLIRCISFGGSFQRGAT